MGTLADEVRDLEALADERLDRIAELEDDLHDVSVEVSDLRAELADTNLELDNLRDEVANLLKLVNCASIGELVDHINANR